MQSNGAPRNALKPPKIWRGHEDEFDAHTSGWDQSPDQSPTLRFFPDFQSDLDFTSDRSSFRRLNKAAAQANDTHYNSYARPCVNHDSRRYLAEQTTEASFLQSDIIDRNLCLEIWLTLRLAWMVGYDGRLVLLHIQRPGMTIKRL